MANTFKTPTWMAKEILRHFENNNTFSKYVNKDYRKEYMNTDVRPGTTISIPKPARFAVTSGAVASFPDLTEESVSLTVAQYNASFAPTSVEMTTAVDRERFSERYLKPLANALAAQIDKDGLALAISSVYNTGGTAGTTPTTFSAYLDAKAIPTELSMPIDDQIACIVNPAAEAKIIDALKGLFQSSTEIEKQYKTGKMGLAGGMKWSMDQLVSSHTSGARGGTPLVNGASQSGATLVTDAWTAAAANRVKKGDVFTIAGVYAVNPITKLSTGRLQQFVVTADTSSDGSGNATLPISPSITTSGTLQTVDSAPADNAALTFHSAASTLAAHNLIFHKDAFTLASIPMQTYGGLDKCAVEYDAETGIAIRIMQGVDVTNDKLLVRGDVLYGWAATRPEWAVRVEG
jgi:hypothetical protein